MVEEFGFNISLHGPYIPRPIYPYMVSETHIEALFQQGRQAPKVYLWGSHGLGFKV